MTDEAADAHEAATRAAYDTVAVAYAELLRDELASKPLFRSILQGFAELVAADGGGRVGDLGCGPGRITAHLHELGLGLDVFGVDLSPAMVEVARRTHAARSFRVGSMAALDEADGALAGIVVWYSIIHTPPPERPALFAELARVLRPGGHLLAAFQVGDEAVHLDAAYGHALSLDVYRLDPAAVQRSLVAAGFDPVATLVTEPEGREQQPQAFLVARRAGTTRG